MGRPIATRAETPDDLTDRPGEWPAWVLAFRPEGPKAGRFTAFYAWREQRSRWVVEHTSLWRDFRGRPFIGEFGKAARRERRRRTQNDAIER